MTLKKIADTINGWIKRSPEGNKEVVVTKEELNKLRDGIVTDLYNSVIKRK